MIVATLGRPSLQNTVRCLQQQTLPKDRFKFVIWIKEEGEINEYDGRNRAVKGVTADVIAFCDDDTLPPPEWAEKGLAYFEKDPNLMILTGPLEGDLWGHGQIFRLSQPRWFVGANIFVRKTAFDAVGGFEVDWSCIPPPSGWRSDSDLGLRIIEKFGEKAYLHAEDVVMVHDGPMQSQWQPCVEGKFYLRHRRFCIEQFAPVDVRLDQFVVQQGIETTPEMVAYLNWLVDRHPYFHRARPLMGAFYACYHCETDFATLDDYRKHLAANGRSTTEIPQPRLDMEPIRWYVPPDAPNYVPLEPHERNIVEWMKKELTFRSEKTETHDAATQTTMAHPVPKGTFVDIGAERGLFTLNLAPFFKKVHALEPFLDYWLSLRDTVKLNGLGFSPPADSKVVLHQAAAWNRNTDVVLGRFEINKKAEWSVEEPGKGIFDKATGTGSSWVGIPAIAVDSLGVEDCRLLKVDAEGQGYKVLIGAEKTLKTTEMVLFEIHELGGSFEESNEGRGVLLWHGFERQAQWFQSGAQHELWVRQLPKAE